MDLSDQTLPQSIRYMLLKTAYPNITRFNPACSSELLTTLTRTKVPTAVSLLFLHVFGSSEKPELAKDDLCWINQQLSDMPALRAALQDYLQGQQ